jgi:hypothetical protein
MRSLFSLCAVLAVAALIAVWLSAESRAQTAERPSFTGAWTLNKDLSDQPPDRGGADDTGQRGRRGGYGGGGGHRGGYGGSGGGYGRGGYGGGPAMDAEAIARMRTALRDIINPPDHVTISQSDSMIVVTGGDGRTTRLSLDGKKVKDENTNLERKNKWDGGKLVSEITGLPAGKITQIYSIDPEHHQLRIVATMEGRNGQQPRTITHVYDADAR